MRFLLSVLAVSATAAFAVTQTKEKANPPQPAEEKAVEPPDPEPEEGGWVPAAAYSRDGRWLALTRADTKGVTVFDTATWKAERTLGPLVTLSHAVVFSADGGTVFAACFDGTVYSWDRKTGKAGVKFEAKAGYCSGVVLSPDGKLLASGHVDAKAKTSCVRLWDVAAGKAVRTVESDGQVAPSALCFSPDGKTLAAGYSPAKPDPNVEGFYGVIEWDVTTGKEVKRYDTPRVTAGARPVTQAVAFTPDGKWVVVGGGEAVAVGNGDSRTVGHLWLFDRKTAQLEKTLAGDRDYYISCVTVSKDGAKLVAATNAAQKQPRVGRAPASVQCWDAATWEVVWTHDTPAPYTATGVIAAPDGRRVGVAALDGFTLLDASTGAPRGGLVRAVR